MKKTVPKKSKEHEKRVEANVTKKGANTQQGVVQQKWFDDRMREMGVSVKMVADHFGTYSNMVWRMTSGKREVTPGEIAEWARYLKVPLAVAFQKFGYNPPGNMTRVIGAMRANGRVTIYPPNMQRETEAPAANTDLVALVVEAPQSALAIFDGSHLFYEPSTIVRHDTFGRLAVVELGDHPAPIVGMIDRATQIGRSKIVVFGGDEAIESRQLISATPVVWQRL